MKKQFAVIGLGNFGFYLATALFQKGHEVLGIDIKPKLVQEIRDRVSRAVIADATDPQAMKELELSKMDAVVVSIGSILNNSILATLNIKDLGAKRVVAKAVSEAHGRILRKIGADEIYFPEKDLALTAAQRLDNPNVLDYLPFMEGYSIVQLAPPASFIGKSLIELDLINRFGIQVIAIKELVPENVVMIPTGRFVVKDSDILVLLGPDKALVGLQENAG
ncbi:Ktr system potassium uptake protein C [Desulfosarcina cetonica]|uniref:potassium channel family protein n=1 Tax=Desulfosarcina cetonica TaxID=90730 RepID=UPI0006D056B9|nr:TrkA family potassium uptake protein [Desulfosarcina cetonica]VTR71017.1 Ktr system potassium uptake protein C [Desulfosarcina cetonica]